MVKENANIDALVRKAVFGSEDEKAHARWMIWELGQQAGVRPASIHELYMARGRGEVPLAGIRRRVHLGFEDPAAKHGTEAEVLKEFRRVRDEMAACLRAFYDREIATSSGRT